MYKKTELMYLQYSSTLNILTAQNISKRISNLKADHSLHYFFKVFSFRGWFSSVDDDRKSKFTAVTPE